MTRIAESGYVAGQDAFSVLDAAARTDAVSQIRCIAIRAFSRYSDDRPVGTLLAVLEATPESKQAALPPDNHVLFDASTVLAGFNRNGLIAGSERDRARAAFIRLAGRTAPRDVRIVALRALADCRDRSVFAPLISALHENDFMLADTAERSLMALTGTTHDYNPDAWERWLASSHDPFARAGQEPATTRPASPSWWEQERLKWQRAFRRS